MSNDIHTAILITELKSMQHRIDTYMKNKKNSGKSVYFDQRAMHYFMEKLIEFVTEIADINED